MSPLEEGIEATAAADRRAPSSTASAAATSTGPQESRAHPQAYDPEARRRLRELSKELTGVHAARS